jgi:hypothetical protein
MRSALTMRLVARNWPASSKANPMNVCPKPVSLVRRQVPRVVPMNIGRKRHTGEGRRGEYSPPASSLSWLDGPAPLVLPVGVLDSPGLTPRTTSIHLGSSGARADARRSRLPVGHRPAAHLRSPRDVGATTTRERRLLEVFRVLVGKDQRPLLPERAHLKFVYPCDSRRLGQEACDPAEHVTGAAPQAQGTALGGRGEVPEAYV